MVVKLSTGGVSLILTDVRFGLFYQNLVTNKLFLEHHVRSLDQPIILEQWKGVLFLYHSQHWCPEVDLK